MLVPEPEDPMTALWATVFITPACMSILERSGLAAPGGKDKCWGVGLASMSFLKRLGDLSCVFTALLALSYTAEFFPTPAACFTQGELPFPAAGLWFARGFSFQTATIPLGAPVADFAVMEGV